MKPGREETPDLRAENEELTRRLADAETRLAQVIGQRDVETCPGIEPSPDLANYLSTPVLQVRSRLLIVPLIGPFDSLRARSMIEQLLDAVRKHRARAVVVDVTGVVALDTTVANHLLQAVEAARLLGAHVIISGISAVLAATIVGLGVGFPIRTVGDLQSAIEEAERLLN